MLPSQHHDLTPSYCILDFAKPSHSYTYILGHILNQRDSIPDSAQLQPRLKEPNMAFIKPSGRSDIPSRAIRSSEVATSIPALALVKHSALLPSPPPNSILFDNACGAGILTSQLLSQISENDRKNISIICGDLDLTMIDMMNERIKSNSWSNVTAQKLDSHHTALPDNHFTHVLMNFGPQLMKDAKQTLAESHRILQPTGILGFTTWVMPGFMPSMKAVFPNFDPSATPVAGEWRDAEKIKEILNGLGFEDVKVEVCQFETEDEDVEGYLELFTDTLMKPFFAKAGEQAKSKYGEYVRQPGNLKMQWTAFVVIAAKVSNLG